MIKNIVLNENNIIDRCITICRVEIRFKLIFISEWTYRVLKRHSSKSCSYSFQILFVQSSFPNQMYLFSNIISRSVKDHCRTSSFPDMLKHPILLPYTITHTINSFYYPSSTNQKCNASTSA